MHFSSAAVLMALASTAAASTSVHLTGVRTDLMYAKALADKLAKDDKSTLKPASLTLQSPSKHQNTTPRTNSSPVHEQANLAALLEQAASRFDKAATEAKGYEAVSATR